MTFSIIGTGNMAWFLGTKLVSGEHNCIGIYSRNQVAAQVLADTLLAEKIGHPDEVADEEADICFMAVTDSAIHKVASTLTLKQTVLVHTAGAVSISELERAATDLGVLWPVYSILKNNLPTHRDIPCGWEATTEKAKRYLLEMGHALTDILFEAGYEQRKWLHVAAVMSNNFTNHLMAICEQICRENQLPFATLLPIIEQTFERIKHTNPQNNQTGPAIRRDITTLNTQMALLYNHPYWQRIYEAMTDSIQEGF